MSAIKAGSFDGEPFFISDAEAWVFSGGKWSWANPIDVGHNGRVLSPDEFGKRFGPLPPLPKTAFHSSGSPARSGP